MKLFELYVLLVKKFSNLKYMYLFFFIVFLDFVEKKVEVRIGC